MNYDLRLYYTTNDWLYDTVNRPRMSGFAYCDRFGGFFQRTYLWIEAGGSSLSELPATARRDIRDMCVGPQLHLCLKFDERNFSWKNRLNGKTLCVGPSKECLKLLLIKITSLHYTGCFSWSELYSEDQNSRIHSCIADFEDKCRNRSILFLNYDFLPYTGCFPENLHYE